MTTKGSRRRRVVTVLLLWLAGWIVVLAYPDGVVGGDLPVYFDRILAIEAGGIPYLDPVFEHLPGMLIPLFAARVLSGFGDAFVFSVVFSVLMAACVLGCVTVWGRVAGERSADTFLLLAAPLIPLVVFRNDPWVTLLAVAALAPSRRAGFAGVLAILSKGWPLVFAVREWFSRRPGRVVAYGVAGVVAAAAFLSPGFVATQDAVGVHSETLVGSLIGLTRALAGVDVGVDLTTAAYLDAPTMALAIGPLLALATGLIGVAGLRRNPGSLPALGLLVAAVILASRLFSTQYVFWLLPFVAASTVRANRRLALALSVASLGVILFWNGLFTGFEWWALAVGRNLLFAALVVGLAREVLRKSGTAAGSDVAGSP